METSIHAENVNAGDSGNAGLTAGNNLELLHKWLDSYSLAAQEEEDIKRRYQQLLMEAAKRRQSYADAIICVLQGSTPVLPIFPHTPTGTPDIPEPVGNSPSTDATDSESENVGQDNSSGELEEADRPDGASTIELVESHFTKRGSLKKAVLHLFAEEDTFLSSDDVLGHLKLRFPKERFDSKQVIDAVRDSRRTGQLAGYRLRLGSTNKYTYINGLASFFINVADNLDAKLDEVKSEYQNKLLQRMIDLESSTKPETSKEQPKNEVELTTLFASGMLG